MDAIILIEYVFALTLSVYLLAAAIVWIYELKRNALYTELQKQIRFLESLHMCTALRHIKMYKIMEDYRYASESLEKVQRLIFEKVLFIIRHPSQKKEGNRA